MKKVWVVYCLSDPRTKARRYVGCTCASLTRRLFVHMWSAKNRHPNTPRGKWLNELADSGLFPDISVLETCYENWQEYEKKWIAAIRSDGCDLLNLTDGGLGSKGFNKSPETLAKMAEKATGFKHSEETKRRLAEIRKAQPESVKQAISATLTGRKLSDQHRASISAGLLKRDWHPSPEHLERLRTVKRQWLPQYSEKQRRSKAAKGPRNPGTFKGVMRSGSRWQAKISTPDGKRITIGSFATATDAAQAYDREALRIWGPTAYLNLPAV